MKTSLLSVSLLLTINLFSQVDFFDDFESYQADQLSPQSERWTTWSGEEEGIEDPYVQPFFVYSGINAVEISGNILYPEGGPIDCILKLGNIQSGVYELSFKILVNDENGFYYNMQHFETPGIEWAFAVNCEPGGIVGGPSYCTLTVGQQDVYFEAPRGQWLELKHLIDLDTDEISFSLDDVLIHNWPFSWQENETVGTKQIGGVNFFPAEPDYIFYVDDVNFSTITSSKDLNTAIDIKLYPSLAEDEITIELTSGDLSQVAIGQLVNIQGVAVKKITLDQLSTTIDISDLPSGTYYALLQSDKGRLVAKKSWIKL